MPAIAAQPRNRTIVRREAQHDSVLKDLPPFLDRIYRQRGVRDFGELDYSLAKLRPPDGLSGIDDAAAIIIDAIVADASILIVGDYDTDGATGCAVGYLALKAMGARHVAYMAPDRFEFGYGLTEKIVAYASSAAPDLLITVDNGISSVAGVKLAQENGMSVIVTDHHLPGDELPPADTIVNPQLPGDRFASKNLAGVGVIFYVMAKVRSCLVAEGWFEREGIAPPNMADYLDLVALGTVADMVKLDHNNRILVRQGLRRINSGRCRFGIRTLLESGKRQIGKITEQDLGFIVAPRLNAAGRLDDITIGIKCLISDNRNEVIGYVEQLERLNRERRALQTKMLDEAMSIVEDLRQNLPDAAPCYCLVKENWHQGIVGLVASRVVEMTGKPAVAFAPAGDGAMRGSARSVNGLNIRDVFAEIDTESPELMQAFGGHAMAAGLTIKAADISEFRDRFERQVISILGRGGAKSIILTDGELDSIDVSAAEALLGAGPWGQGFPQPIFDGYFRVTDCRVVGEIHLQLRVEAENTKRKCDAIYFGYFDAHEDMPDFSSRYRIAYELLLDEYRSKRSAKMKISYMELAQDEGSH